MNSFIENLYWNRTLTFKYINRQGALTNELVLFLRVNSHQLDGNFSSVDIGDNITVGPSSDPSRLSA